MAVRIFAQIAVKLPDFGKNFCTRCCWDFGFCF